MANVNAAAAAIANQIDLRMKADQSMPRLFWQVSMATQPGTLRGWARDWYTPAGWERMLTALDKLYRAWTLGLNANVAPRWILHAAGGVEPGTRALKFGQLAATDAEVDWFAVMHRKLMLLAPLQSVQYLGRVGPREMLRDVVRALDLVEPCAVVCGDSFSEGSAGSMEANVAGVVELSGRRMMIESFPEKKNRHWLDRRQPPVVYASVPVMKNVLAREALAAGGGGGAASTFCDVDEVIARCGLVVAQWTGGAEEIPLLRSLWKRGAGVVCGSAQAPGMEWSAVRFVEELSK